ncbi:hypothetical protein SK128_006010, partial [Halocaridina rubra]
KFDLTLNASSNTRLPSKLAKHMCNCLRDGDRERNGVSNSLEVENSSDSHKLRHQHIHGPSSKSTGSSKHNYKHPSHDDDDEDGPDIVKTANGNLTSNDTF